MTLTRIGARALRYPVPVYALVAKWVATCILNAAKLTNKCGTDDAFPTKKLGGHGTRRTLPWPLAPPLLKLSETARCILDPKASRSASAKSLCRSAAGELALAYPSCFSPNAFYLRIH
jgi:hypothetical protein